MIKKIFAALVCLCVVAPSQSFGATLRITQPKALLKVLEKHLPDDKAKQAAVMQVYADSLNKGGGKISTYADKGLSIEMCKAASLVDTFDTSQDPSTQRMEAKANAKQAAMQSFGFGTLGVPSYVQEAAKANQDAIIYYPTDKCKALIKDIVWAATGLYYNLCGVEKLSHIDGQTKCVRSFYEFQGQIASAIGMAKEWAKMPIHNEFGKDSIICEDNFRTISNDDYIRCKSVNTRRYYEFQFDDVRESFDNTIRESIISHIYWLHGVSGIKTSQQKCNEIAKTAEVFNVKASYRETGFGSICALSFNDKTSINQLRTSCGINPFELMVGDDIQINATLGIDAQLRGYVAEKCGINADDVMCTLAAASYTGDGGEYANSLIFDGGDDIITCSYSQKDASTNETKKYYIDFVFDDMSEHNKGKVNAGNQAMGCIVMGGTYNGKECMHLNKTQCDKINETMTAKCPSCNKAYWDAANGMCVLPDAASETEKQDAINAASLVVGTAAAIVITVVTAGTGAVAIALVVVETSGAIIEGVATHQINEALDEFFKKSGRCKDASCAPALIKEGMERIVDFANDMEDGQVRGFDTEMARLANFIPDDDEIWATMLVNGTDMADNKLGFFDADSWQPEQVWRAVGIGLQLTSLITGITKWAISKSSLITKSTTAIKQKFARAIQSIDNAPENTLTSAQMAVKRQLPNKTKAVANANKLDIIDPSKLTGDDIIYYDLWKKYAPRNQPFDDFKAMGTLDEIQEMSKSWISWEDIEYRNQLIKQRVEFLQADKEAMNLFQSTRSVDAVAEQYPYFANILRQERELYAKGVPKLNSGFAGTYSTFNPELRNFVRQRQDLASVQDKIETTEEIYKRFLNQSVVDEVASLRAEQIDNLINSNPTYKRYKDRFDYLTPEERQKFATDLIRDIEKLNGVDVSLYTKVLQDDNLLEGVGASYRSTSDKNWQYLNSETHMDFHKKQNYESFIEDLSHEVGGHAIDHENPNAGALGAQLQNTIANKSYVESDIDYDAYMKTATEQSAYRIGAATAKAQHVDELIVQEFDPYKGFFDSMLERGGSDTFSIYTELVDDGGKIMTPSPDMVTNITNVLDGKAKYQVHGDDTYQIEAYFDEIKSNLNEHNLDIIQEPRNGFYYIKALK